MSRADPCNCSTRCPHDDRCLGGHADYPNDHWYPCDKCTPKTKVTFGEALKRRKSR